MLADQITWDGQAHTLDKLYADIKQAWVMICPGLDLKDIKARKMLKVIQEMDRQLGVYLQEQVDKKVLQLDDHVIMKEAEDWLDRKALVHSGSQNFGHSVYFSEENKSLRSNRDLPRYRSKSNNHERRRSSSPDWKRTFDQISRDKFPDFDSRCRSQSREKSLESNYKYQKHSREKSLESKFYKQSREKSQELNQSGKKFPESKFYKQSGEKSLEFNFYKQSREKSPECNHNRFQWSQSQKSMIDSIIQNRSSSPFQT